MTIRTPHAGARVRNAAAATGQRSRNAGFLGVPAQHGLVRRCALFLLVVGIGAPYLQILPIGSDLQPTAMLASLLVLLVYPDRFRSNALRLLWLMLLIAIVIAVFDDWNLNTARAVANYASFVLVTTAVYSVAVKAPFRDGRWLHYITYTWAVVGLIQAFFVPDFATGLLSDRRSTEDRGVISLAVEPSLYASFVFVLLILYFLRRQEWSIHGLFCIAQILLLAQSSTVAVVAAPVLAVYFLMAFRLAGALLPLLFYGLWEVVLRTDWSQPARIIQVLRLLSEDWTRILVLDSSANYRFYQIYYSIVYSLSDFLRPHAYNAWRQAYDDNPNRFIGYYIEASERVGSALGGGLFELGVFGLILPGVCVWSALHYFGHGEMRRAVVLLVAMIGIMLTSVPLGCPVYGLVIGFLLGNKAPHHLPGGNQFGEPRRFVRKVSGRGREAA